MFRVLSNFDDFSRSCPDRLLITSKIVSFTSILIGQAPFVTTWKTDNPGVSNSTSITIPTHHSHVFNYEVDWDNDSVYDDTGLTGSITHDFGSSGKVTIAIRGNFPRIYFNNGGDKEILLSIDRWGDQVWET